MEHTMSNGKRTRWKKGQSGNPRGRPRKAPGTGAPAPWLMRQMMDQPVTCVENGEVRQITRLVDLTAKICEKADNGDLAAMRIMLDYSTRFDRATEAAMRPPKEAKLPMTAEERLACSFAALRRPAEEEFQKRKANAAEHDRACAAWERRRARAAARGETFTEEPPPLPPDDPRVRFPELFGRRPPADDGFPPKSLRAAEQAAANDAPKEVTTCEPQSASSPAAREPVVAEAPSRDPKWDSLHPSVRDWPGFHGPNNRRKTGE
jgi:hypothetical protein